MSLLLGVLVSLLLVVPASAAEADPVYELSEPVVVSAHALASAGDGFPFYGSSWVKGTASGLGEVALFFPINRKDGYLGLDSSGRLFNVSDASFTGVLYDSSGASYYVSFGSFATPRYRLYSGSSYQYYDLYLVPSESNLVLPDSPSPTYSVSDLLPFIGLLFLGGVLVVCFMKK